jgi:hypothetical protein
MEILLCAAVPETLKAYLLRYDLPHQLNVPPLRPPVSQTQHFGSSGTLILIKNEGCPLPPKP